MYGLKAAKALDFVSDMLKFSRVEIEVVTEDCFITDFESLDLQHRF
jgi:hypothetical protein